MVMAATRPHNEGVPLPLPDVADQPPGMVAEVLDLSPGHWEAAGMEEMDAQFDERNEEKQGERRDYLGTDLRGDLA